MLNASILCSKLHIKDITSCSIEQIKISLHFTRNNRLACSICHFHTEVFFTFDWIARHHNSTQFCRIHLLNQDTHPTPEITSILSNFESAQAPLTKE